MADPIATGEVIAGKYRVERVIARGGMGMVLLATHLQLGETVAIKLLLPEVVAREDTLARFLREARAAARLKNEHVVRVFDVGTTDRGQIYMVMEFLEGTDLDQAIRSRGPLPISEAVDYLLQACEGVAEAHRMGIIHRDLKPANLFLVRRSDGSNLVKLLDFGISKQPPAADGSGSQSATKTSVVMGSPLYMSPEQLRSTRSVDTRTDIWSLGVVLFEAVTGKNPFAAESFPDVCARVLTQPPDPLPDSIPEDVAQVIHRCLTKQPGERYADVGELALALKPFASPEAQFIGDRVARIIQSPVSGPAVSATSGNLPSLASENQGGASPHATASSFTATNPSRAISPGTIALLSAVALLVMGTFIGGGYLVYRMFLAPRAVAQAPESSSMVAAGQNPIASAKPPEVVPSTQVDLLAQKTPETPSSAAPSVAASVAPSASASASAVASAPVRPKAGSSPKKGGSGKKPSFGGRD